MPKSEIEIHRDMLNWMEHFIDWEDIILYDGFEEALVGIVDSYGSNYRAVYDLEKCVLILVERDGMSFEEAEEYFSFNVLGMYVGEHTPVFLYVGPNHELLEKTA